MKWTKINEGNPPEDKYVILACPEFCESGYYIAKWNGEEWIADGYGVMEESDIEAWSLFNPYYEPFFSA